MVAINKERLINQIKKDEGFTSKAFWDIKQFTFGYGCCAPNKDATITEAEASKILVPRIEQSIKEFDKMFPGEQGKKFNDVRAECFINMLFNMGMGQQGKPEKGGLYSFTNTLAHIFDYAEVDWSRVAYNLRQSKWFKQVGPRAERICKQIETGEYS